MPLTINMQNTQVNSAIGKNASGRHLRTLTAHLRCVTNAPEYPPLSGLKRLPWGISHHHHKKIPSSNGLHAYGSDLTGSKPRTDLTNGVWPEAKGTMPGKDEEFLKLVEQHPKGGLIQMEDINLELQNQMKNEGLSASRFGEEC